MKMDYFGVFMLAWGAFTLGKTQSMKKEGIIPKGVMVSKKANIPHNADVAGFIRDMYWKGMVLGVLGCIMGITDMVNLFYPQPQVVKIVVYVVFFASLAIFGICLKVAQKKYLHL